MSNQILDENFREKAEFEMIQFPLDFVFKITSFHNDFYVNNKSGETCAFARQKMFKFRESVGIYQDDTLTKILYHINADRWIDFNGCYSFTDNNNQFLGSIARKGMKSIWKASYHVYKQNKEEIYQIKEENPWAKIGDAILGEIPIISFFTGYLFHPKYKIIDQNGNTVARLSKIPSFWGRHFQLTEVSTIPNEDKLNIMLSVMMMVLLERQRG